MSEKILIVDDDTDTLRLVGMLLQRKGYQIIAANNGNAALEKVRIETPDLVLLDVMMPDMDGYEVLRRLRDMPTTKTTPVIMFTAKAQVDDKVTGFEAGADDYLTKPTHPAELLARVKSILARAKTELPAAPPPPTSGGKPQKPGTMVGVLSAKGGQGVSTVALNLGGIFAKVAGNTTVIADMQPGDGSLSGYLGYRVQGGLVSLLTSDASTINPKSVEAALVQHSTGIRLLPASYLPSDGKYLCNSEHFSAIYKSLKLVGKYIILDLGARLLANVEKAVEVCDQLVIVTEPVPEAMAQTKALLGELSLRVLGLDQIQVVISSRHRSDNHLSLRDVQDRLGHKVIATISPVPDLANQAVLESKPMVMIEADNLTTQQYTKLAQGLIKASQTPNG